MVLCLGTFRDINEQKSKNVGHCFTRTILPKKTRDRPAVIFYFNYSTAISTVHRPAFPPLIYLGPLNASINRQCDWRIGRFFGLYSSAAYIAFACRYPVVAEKKIRCPSSQKANGIPNSHKGKKTLSNILNSFNPRDGRCLQSAGRRAFFGTIESISLAISRTPSNCVGFSFVRHSMGGFLNDLVYAATRFVYNTKNCV